MDFFIRFANPWVLYFLVPVICAALWFRARRYRYTTYRYSLGDVAKQNNYATKHPFKKIFFCGRVIMLSILALLIAKPQLVDTQSAVSIDGIDMVLVLDISGSMQLQDTQGDSRSRVEIAKAEAIRFIEKRTHDAIGLVVFAQDAISRCPITYDRALLKEMVSTLEIGLLNPDGTLLATSIVTAANRLRCAKAKSKVMILLTDGEPSEGDMSPQLAIEIAQKMGIKIYTVGIGSQSPQLLRHPLYGVVQVPGVNSQLLTKIANDTGGKFFMARSADDMRAIYDTIDSLEKTVHETPIFSNYQDICMPYVVGLIVLGLTEVLLSTCVWFSI